jgi:hypothetical protein
MISQYWVGQIPGRPLSIQVKDQSGGDYNLSGYTTISAVMLGSYNEELDLTGSSIDATGAANGKIGFFWPTTRSLFDYPGDYVLQLKLEGSNKKDYTSTHIIRVRELGKVR